VASLPSLDPEEIRPVSAANAARRFADEPLDLILAAEVGRALAKGRRGRRNLFTSFFHSRP